MYGRATGADRGFFVGDVRRGQDCWRTHFVHLRATGVLALYARCDEAPQPAAGESQPEGRGPKGEIDLRRCTAVRMSTAPFAVPPRPSPLAWGPRRAHPPRAWGGASVC